ncbi:MAG: hypothetical protein ACLT4C_03730 [Butyricicoccus sp.]
MSAYTRHTLRPLDELKNVRLFGARLTVRSACMTHRLTVRPPSSARKDRGSAA